MEYKPNINDVLNKELFKPKYYGRVLYGHGPQGSKIPYGSKGSSDGHSIFNNSLIWFVILLIIVIVVIICIMYRYENEITDLNVW